MLAVFLYIPYKALVLERKKTKSVLASPLAVEIGFKPTGKQVLWFAKPQLALIESKIHLDKNFRSFLFTIVFRI